MRVAGVVGEDHLACFRGFGLDGIGRFDGTVIDRTLGCGVHGRWSTGQGVSARIDVVKALGFVLFDKLKLKLWAGPVSQDDGFTTSIGALENIRITWRLDDHWLIVGHAEANQVGSGYQYVYSTVGITYDF